MQDGDRASQDLPDVAIRDLMAHQGAQLFELRVRLAVGHELNAVTLGAQRFGPAFLGKRLALRRRWC
jgi:hypothetical protein